MGGGSIYIANRYGATFHLCTVNWKGITGWPLDYNPSLEIANGYAIPPLFSVQNKNLAATVELALNS